MTGNIKTIDPLSICLVIELSIIFATTIAFIKKIFICVRFFKLSPLIFILVVHGCSQEFSSWYHCIHVQILGEGLFDAYSLHWNLLQDAHSKYSALQIAYIPWNQIEDFFKGESAKEDAPTSFNVHWRKN